MKDIAIFTSTLGSGGAEKQAALLAFTLSKHFNVHFIALHDTKEKSCIVTEILNSKPNIKVYILTGSLPQKLKSYARILRSNHIFCAFNYLTACDFWGSIVERFCGVKQIFNGIRNSKISGYKNLLELFSHNFIATKTIFNCYSGELQFKKIGFNPKKCITIPNCYPKIADVINKSSDRKTLHIITVGRFHPQKDYETAIKAISLLKSHNANIIFDICGYGKLESQIKQWIKNYNIEDITHLYIKPNNIPELLQNADIYLSTSLYEGTSNSIMEAMNWCLPIIATNVGDNEYLIKEGTNGFLSPIKDVATLTKSIQYLIDNPQKRITMGKNSNNLLKQNYSLDLFEKRYLKLIHTL